MSFYKIINKCHLFSGLTEADSELLASVVRTRLCQRGEVLFADGEQASGFYVVVSGKVKVYKLSPEGKERILHIVLPGQSFADAAIFADGCFPAYGEALSAAELLFFPKREFLNLLHEHSQLSINMIAGLSKYLRQFTIQIEDLTFRDVPARLARYLVSLKSDSQGLLHLPFSKAQLASNLGTTSETLSRTFRKLADEDIISVSGKNIQIMDEDRLYDVAEGFRDE